MRILLYAHDGLGTGHTRSISIFANALARRGVKNVLCLSGDPFLAHFLLPEVEFVKLPSYHTLNIGSRAYSYSRNLRMRTGDFRDLRSGIISATGLSFKPDVFLSDFLPLGKLGELSKFLSLAPVRMLRILGIRMVIGSPGFMEREYLTRVNRKAIKKYDYIFHYTDPAVYSLKGHPFFRSLGSRLIETGLRTESCPEPVTPQKNGYILLTLGGGPAGKNMLKKVISSIRHDRQEKLVIIGPACDQKKFERLVHSLGSMNTRTLYARSDMEDIYRHARTIIASCGYNTLLETLRQEHAQRIFIPLETPSSEQVMNITILSRKIPLNYLRESQIADKLPALLKSPRPLIPHACQIRSLDWNGVQKASDLICSLAGRSCKAKRRHLHQPRQAKVY